jgi:hypothetical protein
MNRNPVLWYGSLLALLTTVATFGGVDDHIPSEVLFWIRLGTAVAAAAGAVWVRSQVTPLAEPKNAAGYPLVKAESSQVVPDDKGGLTLRDDPPPSTVRRFGTP